MAVRVSRQIVEVLGSATDGKARVSRQIIEVLGTLQTQIPIDAESEITLVSTAADMGSIDCAATSTLAPTVTATSNHFYTPSATSAISLTVETNTPQFFGVSTTSILMLSSVAVERSVQLAASSPLAVTHLAAASGPITKSAETVLELDDSAANHIPMPVSASSVLSVSVTVDQRGPLPRSASSPIELEDFADNQFKQRSVTSTVVVASAATGFVVKSASSTIELAQSAIQGVIALDVVSPLTLTSTARNTNIKVVNEAITIELVQIATSSIKMLSAGSPIELEQTLGVLRPHYASADSELVTTASVFDPETISYIDTESGLSQTLGLTLIQAQDIHHYLNPVQFANANLDKASGMPAAASSTLVLVSSSRIGHNAVAENALNLVQSIVTYHADENPESELSLTVTAAATVNRAELVVEQTVELESAVRFVLDTSGVQHLYSPFIGSTTDTDAPTPPSATMPTASELTGFRLLYPSTGTATDELVLRAPNLGNIERLSFDRINRETRGGTLVIYADPIWPKIHTLVLSFSVLKSTEAQGLLTFMLAHLGQEIRLIDWENRAWKGVIINPQDPIVQDGRESFSASFEFEGTRE